MVAPILLSGGLQRHVGRRHQQAQPLTGALLEEVIRELAGSFVNAKAEKERALATSPWRERIGINVEDGLLIFSLPWIAAVAIETKRSEEELHTNIGRAAGMLYQRIENGECNVPVIALPSGVRLTDLAYKNLGDAGFITAPSHGDPLFTGLSANQVAYVYVLRAFANAIEANDEFELEQPNRSSFAPSY